MLLGGGGGGGGAGLLTFGCTVIGYQRSSEGLDTPPLRIITGRPFKKQTHHS